MAEKKTKENMKGKFIGKDDVIKYLATESDFAFELQVLEQFSRRGFQCQHTGAYKDPLTGKSRQFDILGRASGRYGEVWLNIECKNFRESSPLLAHCCERNKEEAYHQLLVTCSAGSIETSPGKRNYVSPGGLIPKAVIKDSIYRDGERVTKNIDQVCYKGENGFVRSDAESFEKISQALSAMSKTLGRIRNKAKSGPVANAVFPVIVIPDGRLWQVTFRPDGTQDGDVVLAEHASLYLADTITVSDLRGAEVPFLVSHIEIITFSYIREFVNEWLGKDDEFLRVIPRRATDLLIEGNV